MPARTPIRFVLNGVTYDEVLADECGVVTLTGWSNRQSAEIAEPILLLEHERLRPQNFWRVHRPEIPTNPLAGFGLSWVVDRYPAGQSKPSSLRDRWFPAVKSGAHNAELSVKIGNHTFACTRPIRYREPAYRSLLNIDCVLKRDDIYGSGLPYAEVPTEILNLVPLLTGPRILDFGCGSGALVKLLRQKGIDAVGIEIDRPEITSNLLIGVADQITFYAGGTLPFPDDSFDTALAFEVIEHIVDFEQALSELKRVARRLIVSVPDIATVAVLNRLDVVPWHILESTHLNFFTESSLRKLLLKFFGSVQMGRMSERTLEGTRYHLSLLAICS